MNSISALFYPMFTMAMVSFLVLSVMFVLRIVAVFQGKVRLDYFRIFQGELRDPVLHQLNNHIRNIFEFPVLFYVVCLAAMSLGQVDDVMVKVAWIFVIARILHAVIHVTINVILMRLAAFLVSIVSLIFLWVHLALMLASA